LVLGAGACIEPKLLLEMKLDHIKKDVRVWCRTDGKHDHMRWWSTQIVFFFLFRVPNFGLDPGWSHRNLRDGSGETAAVLRPSAVIIRGHGALTQFGKS